MNLNKFTLKSQEALQNAQNLASEYNHPQIGPEHLLLALLTQEEELAFTDAVLDHIAEEGFDITYGVRPVKRFIQHEIENPLASEMLTRKLPEKVIVDFDGKNVVFK